MAETEPYKTGDSTGNTWQCWMINTLTGEEKLLTSGHRSESECDRAANQILVRWDLDLYPHHQGWSPVCRQDSRVKMAQYWRDYYQKRADFWSKRYETLRQGGSNPSPQEQPAGTRAERRRQADRLVQATTNALGGWCNRLKTTRWSRWFFSSTLLCAIAFEVLALWKESPKGPQYSTQNLTDIPLSVRELFSTQKSPGAIAIGVAEGNLTPTGQPTASYLSGHTDPGNFATNRGFCSWNKANGLSIKEADRRCLEALQGHSVAMENQLLDLGLTPERHKKAIVMGTDLWNQSNSAGPNFPFTYKAAQERGLQEQYAYVWARVEAFRNEQQQLDASGLFGICKREPYYQTQLTGLAIGSEQWRWNCIKLDQMRRVLAIEQVLAAVE